MKKVYFLISMVVCLFVSSAAMAVPRIKGGRCIAHSYTNNNSIFSCQHIGDVTIAQIYEKGWRVVIFDNNPKIYPTVTLIIEEQS